MFEEFTFYSYHEESVMCKSEQNGLDTFHEGLSIEQFIGYLLIAITCLRVSVSQSGTAVAHMYYRWTCSQIRIEQSFITSSTTCNLLILIVSTSCDPYDSQECRLSSNVLCSLYTVLWVSMMISLVM